MCVSIFRGRTIEFQLHSDQGQYQEEYDSIGHDERQQLAHDSVDDPQAQTDGERELHTEGKSLARFAAVSLPYLREVCRGGHESCHKSYSRGEIDHVWKLISLTEIQSSSHGASAASPQTPVPR